MFSKNCGEKIGKRYTYCPHCGSSTGKPKNEEDWGILGKDDEIEETNQFANPMFGGFSEKMLNKMLVGAMKMLEKEMKQLNQETPLNSNFELYINGKKVDPKNIKVTTIPAKEQKEVQKKPILNPFSQENIKRFSSLPRKEPTTNIRRLSNKVVYEINIPGVESIKDISIIKLEKSIEIKAVSKNTAYAKVIPIDLPIKKYKLEKEKLILELSIKEDTEA
jgi:HSP20 family molecular chaperone IbpA